METNVEDIIIDIDNKKMKIDYNVVNLIHSYKQLHAKDAEAGGILIGRENKETGNIIIEYATAPYEKDRRSRTSFYRKDKEHMTFYKKLYDQYNQIYAYIGEWHTHPEDYPMYSYIDKSNWEKISNINRDKEKIYYHIIVGNKETRVWQCCNTLKKPVRVY